MFPSVLVSLVVCLISGVVYAQQNGTEEPSSLLYPNGGEEWELGETYTIRWDASKYPPDAKVQIIFTGEPVVGRCDFPGGRDHPNTGSYEWTVPSHPRCPLALLGHKHKIRIFFRDKNWENLGMEESKDFFSIICPSQSINLIYPDKGIEESFEVGKTYTIKWDASEYPPDAKVIIALLDTRHHVEESETGNMTIAEITNTGSYEWAIPSFSNEGFALWGSRYKVFVSVEDGGPGKFDVSEDLFSIVQPPLVALLSPNGRERWEIGKTYTIKWSAPKYSSEAVVLLEVVGAVGYHVAKTTNTGSYDWIIPSVLGGRGWVFGHDDGEVRRFCVSIGRGEHDCNDEPFYIVKSFDILFPEEGDYLEAGKTYTIKWDASEYPFDATVKIKLRELYYPGIGEEILVAGTTNTGSYDWTIESTYDWKTDYTHYLLMISIYEDDCQYGESNTIFQIIGPGN